MLSHDDSQLETCSNYRALGAHVAEFTMHKRVFLGAKDAGDALVLGAPNAMRGGSHLGSSSAAQMIARGWCDILASDYRFPAMLDAKIRLHADCVAPLPARCRLVSQNPAAAIGLADHSRTAPDLRADLVLLDWPEGHPPAPVRTWVTGRGGYSSLPVTHQPVLAVTI